jgi:hypothetical protein
LAVQAALQHTVSTQKPDAQLAGPAQVCPLASLHVPAPSHALVPLHAGLPFGSTSPGPTGVVHVPVTQE